MRRRGKVMTQLVGQKCILCKEPIRTILSGRFCSACSQAVHNSCARSDGLPASLTYCPQCGGNPSIPLNPDFGAGREAVASMKEPIGQEGLAAHDLRQSEGIQSSDL